MLASLAEGVESRVGERALDKGGKAAWWLVLLLHSAVL